MIVGLELPVVVAALPVAAIVQFKAVIIRPTLDVGDGGTHERPTVGKSHLHGEVAGGKMRRQTRNDSKSSCDK